MHVIAAGRSVPIQPIVLIVDDDLSVLEALRVSLAPRLEPTYRVETAGSAEEALDWVATIAPEQHPIAVVISDEKMPGLQGTDLLVALRTSPAHRHGGRIIVTGYAGLESAKKAINEAEVVRYFPKPWDEEKQLLPALAEILSDFASRSSLDEYQLAAVSPFATSRAEIETIRRAWWEYSTLLGMSAAEAGIEEPRFVGPEDEVAMHVLVTRCSPRGRVPVASLRINPSTAHEVRVSAVAFMPEDANEATETLLLRTALLDARARGAEHVTCEVPAIRRQVYEALGFEASASTGDSPPTLPMRSSVSPDSTLDGPSDAFARRHLREQRLCRCAQEACPARDYAETRRNYLCPLDMLEGRAPEGFPTRPRA